MQYPTVLVVDDDEDDRLLLRLGFEKASFLNLGLFADAESVLEYLQCNCERLPELIVSDYNMHKLSGLDLLKNIKANNSLNHIDVIILSTSSSQLHIDQCIASGASGYFVKPSSEQGIMDIAKEILSKVRSLGEEQLA